MIYSKLPILLLASSAALAAPLFEQRDNQVVFSNTEGLLVGGQSLDALAKQYQGTAGFETLDLNEKRLIQLSEQSDPLWVTELEKIELKIKGIKFFDITDHQSSTSLSPPGQDGEAKITYEYPKPGGLKKVIKPILKLIDLGLIKESLVKMSSFRTRYYKSDTGKDSSEWLLSTIQSYTDKYASPSLSQLITVKPFAHTWIQSSIIVEINPPKYNKSDPITVVGAHQDSTHMWPFLPAPGADDDASGSTTILEAYRVLLASNYTPSTPLHFMWFSAEEGGLLGSQAIASKYAAEGRKVKAMSQMDMTAFVKSGTKPEVGIIQDFVDPELTKFNEGIVAEYLDIPSVPTKCGYACSDHASFSKAGFQSSFTIESTFENSNKNIHTGNDIWDLESGEFSFEHMKEFVKLSVAFAVELTQ